MSINDKLNKIWAATKPKLFHYRWLITLVAAGLLIVGGILYKNQSHQTYQSNHLAVKPPVQLTDSCASSDTSYQNSYTCYKSELISIINQDDPESATTLLKKQYDKVPYIKSECHQLMHVVGRAAYAKYGNLAEAFAHGDQYCWSGFYHGIMEQVSTEKGYDYIVKNSDNICQPIAAKYGQGSFYDYNCVHGLGHGYMEVLENNLFESLTACDSMGSDWNRSSCYGGVFMQNIMNVQGPEAEPVATYPYLKNDQPMYPCTAVASQYKTACYLMQTSYALQAENYDFTKVFSLCSGTEVSYKDTCYQSLGRDASGQSISDVQRTKNTCLLGPDQEAQINCTVGAAKDFVSYFHNDKKAYELCAQMPTYISNNCSQTVKDYYSIF